MSATHRLLLSTVLATSARITTTGQRPQAVTAVNSIVDRQAPECAVKFGLDPSVLPFIGCML